MTPQKRTRLSPDHRRMQLLDSARTIIRDRGISSLTMEAVAQEAGVSKPLMYKYFDTRLTLLQELLRREFEKFELEMWDRLGAAKDFNEVVEIYVRVNFEQADRSNILNILGNQGDIRLAIKEAAAESLQRTNRLLVTGLADRYKITKKQAATIVALGAGASQMAAERARKLGGNKNKMIDEAVRFILAGIQESVSHNLSITTTQKRTKS